MISADACVTPSASASDGMKETASDREYLLHAVKRFVSDARNVSGVVRIAVIGSLLSSKPRPKDADVLISVVDQFDSKTLAECGRRLKGSVQQRNLGADIFVANQTGRYLGRTCSYRECRPRRMCAGSQCGAGGWLCDDLSILTLRRELIEEPPLVLWPNVVVRGTLSCDAREILLGRD